MHQTEVSKELYCGADLHGKNVLRPTSLSAPGTSES
jgi:hypothetical protein